MLFSEGVPSTSSCRSRPSFHLPSLLLTLLGHLFWDTQTSLSVQSQKQKAPPSRWAPFFQPKCSGLAEGWDRCEPRGLLTRKNLRLQNLTPYLPLVDARSLCGRKDPGHLRWHYTAMSPWVCGLLSSILLGLLRSLGIWPADALLHGMWMTPERLPTLSGGEGVFMVWGKGRCRA